MVLNLRRTLTGYVIYDMAQLTNLGIPGVIVRRFPPGTTREEAEAELARIEEGTA